MSGIRREMPCPYRVIDDLGGAFAMGIFGGSIWHFGRGTWRAPKSTRFIGGIKQMARRAPILAGGFGQWGGLFSFIDCCLTFITKQESQWNQIASGFLTGGILAMRAGHRLALNSAVAGGVLISAMVVVEIYMLKQRKGMDVEMNNEMTEQMVREQRKKYSEIRPDLFTSDGRIKLKRA